MSPVENNHGTTDNAAVQSNTTGITIHAAGAAANTVLNAAMVLPFTLKVI